MWNTNEICDTYPESSWYKVLKNARKVWNNYKSYCTILDNLGQKYSKTDTVVSYDFVDPPPSSLEERSFMDDPIVFSPAYANTMAA